MLTRRLSFEWKKDNIRATAFTPGWVRTEMGSPDATLSVSLQINVLNQVEQYSGLEKTFRNIQYMEHDINSIVNTKLNWISGRGINFASL